MFLNILFILSSVFTFKSDTDSSFYFREHPHLFDSYKNLLVKIRNYEYTPNEAAGEFKAIIKEIRRKYPLTADSSDYSNLVFPLVGSNARAIGGRNGNGFRPRGFNLFDQSVSGSHPAHDIFIYDRNQDCIDDIKGTYIDIVSVSYGVVIAVESGWTPESEYKGGNYVWIYDLERGGLWYYAHTRMNTVVSGQPVKPGDKIAEVGRSGYNAWVSRSDTHLHFMYLNLDSDLYPYPYNTYELLKEAETVYIPTKAEDYKKPLLLKKIPAPANSILRSKKGNFKNINQIINPGEKPKLKEQGIDFQNIHN